jgi:hypothetical protein
MYLEPIGFLLRVLQLVRWTQGSKLQAFQGICQVFTHRKYSGAIHLVSRQLPHFVLIACLIKEVLS